MKQIIDGYEFDFPRAIELYKFDETDKLAGNHYHGVSVWKSVDVMSEFPDYYIWIEIKEYSNDKIEEIRNEKPRRTKSDDYHHRSWLRNNLAVKYQHTFLYRYCENKLDKPVFYVCLLNFDDALLLSFFNDLKCHIPVGMKSGRWSRPILADNQLFVLNESAWKRKLEPKIGSCRKI